MKFTAYTCYAEKIRCFCYLKFLNIQEPGFNIFVMEIASATVSML